MTRALSQRFSQTTAASAPSVGTQDVRVRANDTAGLELPPHRPWRADDGGGAALVIDRDHRAIRFTDPLWSSASTAWQGFPMERHLVGPVGRLSHFALPELLLGVCTRGAAVVEFDDRVQTHRAVMRESNFNLLNRGDAQRAVGWRGMRETLYVWLTASMIEQLLPGEADRGHLNVRPQYAASDTQVTRLAMCMYDEAMAGCPGGTGYAESLSLALTKYVLARYGCDPADARNANVFVGSKRARLQKHVDVNLARNMSLAELAALVGLSAHHFLEVFKNSFEVTPHQYVLRLRTERAKLLLLEGDATSISDIALSLGFADQSHFTRIFRRLTGSTPSQFRRDAQPRSADAD